MHKKLLTLFTTSLVILVIMLTSVKAPYSVNINKIESKGSYKSYSVDTQVSLSLNHPPLKPTQPTPANNSKNINLNPILGVRVLDPDNDNMTVVFYNASSHLIIGIASNISNNTFAYISWQNLSYNRTYRWYVVVNDSKNHTFSDVFTFTTIKRIDLKIMLSSNTAGVKATVKNNDSCDYQDIQWQIHITSKRHRIKAINISDYDVIDIKAKEECIILKSLKGFGRININISLNVMNQTIYTDKNALLIRYRVITY